jgi:hypothetical protein
MDNRQDASAVAECAIQARRAPTVETTRQSSRCRVSRTELNGSTLTPVCTSGLYVRPNFVAVDARIEPPGKPRRDRAADLTTLPFKMEITGRGRLTQSEWLGIWLALVPACVLVAFGLSLGAWPIVALGIPAGTSAFTAASPRFKVRTRHRLIAAADILAYGAFALLFVFFKLA